MHSRGGEPRAISTDTADRRQPRSAARGGSAIRRELVRGAHEGTVSRSLCRLVASRILAKVKTPRAAKGAVPIYLLDAALASVRRPLVVPR